MKKNTSNQTSDQATCLHNRKTTTNVDIRSAFVDSLFHPVQDGKDVRIFFQNVKGLPKDYDYFMTSTQAIGTDIIVGMPKNKIAACWQHQHPLQSSFASRAGKHYGTTKISFQYPDATTDPPVPEKETFQSGCSLTMTAGSLVPTLHGGNITDPTGLGHWSGQSPTHSSSLPLRLLHTESAQDQLGPCPRQCLQHGMRTPPLLITKTGFTKTTENHDSRLNCISHDSALSLMAHGIPTSDQH